ncbi:HET-domain-containing protein [Acephala macrosclerotiorum]|nr:HET-domain-containing protein [Acephala macrosclerotiorum]
MRFFGYDDEVALDISWGKEQKSWICNSSLALYPAKNPGSELQNCLSSNRPVEILDPAITWLSDCVPSSLPKNTKYATLSHCWGVDRVEVKLTKNSLAAFHDRIVLESLSKTFRDAVHITQKLGIEYLWIDSLCIIQDDPEDWRKESTAMSEVYGNSYINIAASSARNGSEGCFYDNNERIERLQVKAKSWIDEQECFQTLEVVPNMMIQNSITWSALASRGWALQERLLSPRTLHFTAAQLFWECNSELKCESFPLDIPASETVSHGYITKGHLSDHWNEILYKYTSCKITQRRDVLVAMSGIIRKLEEQRQDECIASI